jgi:heat shock protein HslJ
MLRYSRVLRALAIATLGGSASFCTRAPDTSAPLVVDLDLDGTEWVLSSIGGRPPVVGSRITLDFSDESLGGYSGCNWYGSKYEDTDSSFRIERAMATARGCLLPAGVSEQEMAYFNALTAVGSYEASDDRLLMRDASNRVILEFTRRVPLPMDPAALVGTHWRLEAIDGVQAISDPPATLRFAADSMSGFGGCRDYTGTYVARGDHIGFTSIAMTTLDCTRGRAAQVREENLTTYLSESSIYRLSADTLEVTTSPGRVVRFVRLR